MRAIRVHAFGGSPDYTKRLMEVTHHRDQPRGTVGKDAKAGSARGPAGGPLAIVGSGVQSPAEAPTSERPNTGLSVRSIIDSGPSVGSCSAWFWAPSMSCSHTSRGSS